MRIPNTAEFIAIFVSTGQLTGFSNQRKIDIILFWSVRGWHTLVSISYSGRWLGLGGTDPTKVRPSLYSPIRWYLQFYCRTFQSSHVSIFIGHICTFYLSIKIQVPDHMWKRGDQWRLHQSPSWPGEIYSQTSALHILIKTIIYLL